MTEGPPAACQAKAELGMHSAQSLGVEGAHCLDRCLLAGQQQVQQSLPLPKGLEGVSHQECQQRELRTAHISAIIDIVLKQAASP